MQYRKQQGDDTRQRILDFMDVVIAEEYRPPTVRELAALLGGVSISVVSAHLREMERMKDSPIVRIGDGARAYTTRRAWNAVRREYRELASTGGDA